MAKVAPMTDCFTAMLRSADEVRALRRVAKAARSFVRGVGAFKDLLDAVRALDSTCDCRDGTDPDEPADRGFICEHDPRGKGDP